MNKKVYFYGLKLGSTLILASIFSSSVLFDSTHSRLASVSITCEVMSALVLSTFDLRLVSPVNQADMALGFSGLAASSKGLLHSSLLLRELFTNFPTRCQSNSVAGRRAAMA